jgi:CheY-like chemotaxis protein
MDTKTLSVLVIEDDEFLVNAYRTKLTKDGFDVHFAADGQEAMKTLETLHPNVILLDLMLPNKDGFAVLEEIKKLSSLSKIPVIVASNLSQKEDIERCKKLGAHDFVVKSELSLDDIVAKIHKAAG